MKGRRIADEKAERAVQLRQKGLSTREIGRRLRIGKSSVSRFTQGIEPEQSDESQTPEDSDMSQNITVPEEPMDPEFRSYLVTLVYIRRFIALKEEMGDYAGVDMGMRGLYKLWLMVKDYFQRKYPQITPPPMPAILREYISKRQADSGSTVSTVLQRAIAEELRQTRKENAAMIQEWKSDIERETLRIMQDVQDCDSRIRDLERKRLKRDQGNS